MDGKLYKAAGGFEARVAQFAIAKAELEENLKRIDECCAEFEEGVREASKHLTACCKVVTGQLLAWKLNLQRLIGEAEHEVESSLHKNSVNLTSQLSQALRHYSKGNLLLFSYSLDFSTLERFFRVEYRQPILPPPTFHRPIAILPDSVLTFDIEKENWAQLFQLSEKILAPHNISSTFISTRTIFVCGGHDEFHDSPVLNTAFLIEEGSVQHLPHMLQRRSAPGVIFEATEKSVMVFGGGDGSRI